MTTAQNKIPIYLSSPASASFQLVTVETNAKVVGTSETLAPAHAIFKNQKKIKMVSKENEQKT